MEITYLILLLAVGIAFIVYGKLEKIKETEDKLKRAKLKEEIKLRTRSLEERAKKLEQERKKYEESRSKFDSKYNSDPDSDDK